MLPVSAKASLSSLVHSLPSMWYGVNWVNSDTTWQPGGARVGSNTEGMVISSMGLQELRGKMRQDGGEE